MGGHVDDAELTYDHPVLSISIGCPCLFLLGAFQRYSTSLFHLKYSSHYYPFSFDLNVLSYLLQFLGGFDKESDPLPIILRSGDILIMGGKSRLRVHAVPKVFTKSLPPLYLHPSTVGRDVIHTEECYHFLNRDILKNCDCSEDVKSKSSAFCETSGYTHLMNSKRSTTLPYNPTIKKQKHDQSTDESTANTENDNMTHEKCDANLNIDRNSYHTRIAIPVKVEADIRCNDGDEARCCRGLTPVQETRVLKYLQATRININVRQVYATQEKQEQEEEEEKEAQENEGKEEYSLEGTS